MFVLTAKCHLRLFLRILSHFLVKDKAQSQELFLICKRTDFIYMRALILIYNRNGRE